jgi:hypothetical protein
MEVGGQRHAPGRLTPGNDSVPIVREAGWAPVPVWTGTDVTPTPPHPHQDALHGPSVS